LLAGRPDVDGLDSGLARRHRCQRSRQNCACRQEVSHFRTNTFSHKNAGVPAKLTCLIIVPFCVRQGRLSRLIRSAIHFFLQLGVFGLLGMGILDSSILFLPFGNDLLVVALTARQPDRFWLYALAATAGSLMGCTITDFLSRKIGQAGLEKIVEPQRVEAVQQRLKNHTFWALGAAALMPPPFPFTVFLIAASALQISRWRVLTAVGLGRFVRFLTLSLLAVKFGSWIINLSKRDELQYFVIALAVISIGGSALSIAKWIRSARRRDTRKVPGGAASAEA
jgi:membrane protein YqaA with SNARE-associated domain